ncbi:hypothetical protein ACH5RR_035995 [Cinchona calisaya]|uniref:Uncharacterized protein n=1 Tax=Cinchona calisaya TaxID=153742 RepID=A0ABD2Y1X2_9GENT
MPNPGDPQDQLCKWNSEHIRIHLMNMDDHDVTDGTPPVKDRGVSYKIGFVELKFLDVSTLKSCTPRERAFHSNDKDENLHKQWATAPKLQS